MAEHGDNPRGRSAGDGASPHAAPPVTQGPMVRRPQPPAWPVVFGGIAIAFGTLGALGGALGFLNPLFMSIMDRMQTPEMPSPVAGMQQFSALVILSSAVALGLGVLLLAGGIGMLRRCAWCVSVVLAWAILKIGYVPAAAWLSWRLQQAQMQNMVSQQGPGGPPAAMMTGIMDMMALAGTAVALLWGWALPVVMLCILGQQSMRAQLTSTARQESQHNPT